MAVDVSTLAVPPQTTSLAVLEAMSVDERWAAWQAKGTAHDRAVRRKIAVAAPLLIVLLAVVIYVLLGR